MANIVEVLNWSQLSCQCNLVYKALSPVLTEFSLHQDSVNVFSFGCLRAQEKSGLSEESHFPTSEPLLIREKNYHVKMQQQPKTLQDNTFESNIHHLHFLSTSLSVGLTD